MPVLQMKPCPFCGGLARLDYITGDDDGKMAYSPECQNRECVIYGFKISGPEYLSQEEAVEAWNHRTT